MGAAESDKQICKYIDSCKSIIVKQNICLVTYKYGKAYFYLDKHGYSYCKAKYMDKVVYD